MRTNWSGNYSYTAPQLHRPRTIEQVQEIVAAASSLRVLGSTHSFNAIADDVSAQISLDGLPHEVEIDGAARTVSFAAEFSDAVTRWDPQRVFRNAYLERVLEPA